MIEKVKASVRIAANGKKTMVKAHTRTVKGSGNTTVTRHGRKTKGTAAEVEGAGEEFSKRKGEESTAHKNIGDMFQNLGKAKEVFGNTQGLELNGVMDTENVPDSYKMFAGGTMAGGVSYKAYQAGKSKNYIVHIAGLGIFGAKEKPDTGGPVKVIGNLGNSTVGGMKTTAELKDLHVKAEVAYTTGKGSKEAANAAMKAHYTSMRPENKGMGPAAASVDTVTSAAKAGLGGTTNSFDELMARGTGFDKEGRRQTKPTVTAERTIEAAKIYANTRSLTHVATYGPTHFFKTADGKNVSYPASKMKAMLGAAHVEDRAKSAAMATKALASVKVQDETYAKAREKKALVGGMADKGFVKRALAEQDGVKAITAKRAADSVAAKLKGDKTRAASERAEVKQGFYAFRGETPPTGKKAAATNARVESLQAAKKKPGANIDVLNAQIKGERVKINRAVSKTQATPKPSTTSIAKSVAGSKPTVAGSQFAKVRAMKAATLVKSIMKPTANMKLNRKNEREDNAEYGRMTTVAQAAKASRANLAVQSVTRGKNYFTKPAAMKAPKLVNGRSTKKS